jgi:ssDNA thymidine ADP-ribosyltransferase, DarT
MGISKSRFDRHILDQSSVLLNYRKPWPKYLFRHEPIENAVEILKSGQILSRTGAEGRIARDIAPDQIIGLRDSAHDKVRLYFRPRNPTQYRIEGIRKPSEFYHGKHGGFIVVFAFDAETILTASDTKFSCGNMQHSDSRILDGDNGFDSLDFSKIYHDSAHRDPEVTRQRCAEVLPFSPMTNLPALRRIIVRTDADVLTVKHYIEKFSLYHYSDLVRKAKGTGIFFGEYTAFDYVDLSPGKINFKLKETKPAADIAVEMVVSDIKTGSQVAKLSCDLKMLQAYYWEHGVTPGPYLLNAKLEGSFAFCSRINIE